MSHFNKHVGKIIDRKKANKLKENWKKTKIATESSFVGSDILNELLNRPGAVGLRISYGLDDEGNMQPVFYACDASGNIISSSSTKTASTLQDYDEFDDGADASVPCPPYCGSSR